VPVSTDNSPFDPPAVSRRALLGKGAGAAAVGVLLPTLLPYEAQSALASPTGAVAAAGRGAHPVPGGDTGATILEFVDGSPALAPDTVVHGTCQFCNADCRLVIGKKAGRVIDVRGEQADPVQDGNLCVKGPMMVQLAYNPLRLTSPLRRVSGAKGDPDSVFEPVGWDVALDVIARKSLALRDAGQARTIAGVRRLLRQPVRATGLQMLRLPHPKGMTLRRPDDRSPRRSGARHPLARARHGGTESPKGARCVQGRATGTPAAEVEQ
jgi:anaerobic selenocysteine-containing dehydrogenase